MSTKRTKPSSTKSKTWAITIEDPKGNALRYVIQDYDAFIDSGLIARRVAISLGGIITSVQTAGVQDEKLRRYVEDTGNCIDEMDRALAWCEQWFPCSSSRHKDAMEIISKARRAKP